MTQEDIERMARELFARFGLGSPGAWPAQERDIAAALRRAYNAGLDTADGWLTQGTPGLREPASLRALKLPE